MVRAGLFAVLTGLLILSSGAVGDDKKQEPKKEDKKVDKAEPAAKLKGTLPPNWKKIGLTDAQVQEIYKIQNKYHKEISEAEAKVKALKMAREKEERAVLTPEQKKHLEELLLKKGE